MLAKTFFRDGLANHLSPMGVLMIIAAVYLTFPGPKLAAATFWYEFYYDLFPHKLQYLWKIEELHKKYGPIVRINPIHLHINDPEYIDEIYASGNRKRNRDPWYYRSEKNGPLGWSVFQTVDHDLHRMRRAALNPFFSMGSIQQLESMISDKVQKLCNRLKESHQHDQVVSLTAACAALTMDIISAYAFGTEAANLDKEDYAAEVLDSYTKLTEFAPIARQFRWVTKLCLTVMPPWIMHKISPAAALIPKNRAMFKTVIQQAISNQNKDSEGKGNFSQESGTGQPSKGGRTVFQDILRSKLPEHEKLPARLAAEANLLMIAGTETTARALSVSLFHILDNPWVLNRLREELSTLATTPRPSVAALSALPFLTATVTEGLRLSHVVSSRMPRYAPEENLVYKGWSIPAGTCVMQSHYLLHMNSEIFPEPYTFDPRRWLNDAGLKRRYFMGFGRGSRICLGINLVYAELFLSISQLITRFDMSLYETFRERDVDVKRDSIIGLPSIENEGIKVRITGSRDADGRAKEGE
ncbi:hypothetical protein NLG97_g985 [Lecanicillium saksenae]|uniref:Uncharacterized protein n=1 Tax=Lecanicillium saksenae TaxID=468837 RepID=A0ACC1R7N3_9HYPO|nr:hypothetical protein NLG97_g985 [Lecanicillium saksenae]